MSQIVECTSEELATELEVYERILNKAISKSSSEIIPNAGEHHAALMMSKLFALAKKKVCMVVGSFIGNVSNKDVYQKSLEKFLNEKDIEIKVLLVDDPNQSSDTYTKLLHNRDVLSKNIEIRKASEATINFLSSSFDSKSIVHFAVFDDDKYRLEISPATFSAFGCFNDKVRAARLLDIFDTAYQSAVNFN